MPVILNPKLTDAGKAAAVNASATGLQLAITHIALGTGQYDSATAGAGMTTMAARKEQVQVGAGLVTGAGGFRINIRFEAWEGTPNPYNATELGFYAGDPTAGGILFAVFSHPSEVIVQRNSLDYVASFNLQITDVPAGSVTVVVDPGASQALALLSQHENASNPHVGYVRKMGDTSTGPQLGVTAPQHDNGKTFATTEFVKRAGLSFPDGGSISITANTTLTVANMGRWADIKTTGAALTLPLAAACPVGASIPIRVSALSGLLVAQGGDAIISPLVGSGTSLQVIQGETITVTRNAPGVWEVLGTGFRMPAGIVSYFAGNSPPPGWLKLNGSLLLRDSYPALWGYAQSTNGVVSESSWNAGFSGRFSSGTAGNNFRIPDLRGTFLRTVDDGRGLDAGREWGTFQDQANRSHNHSVSDPGHGHGLNDPGHAHSINDPGHAHGINDPGHAHDYMTYVGWLAQSGSSTLCWVGGQVVKTGGAATGVSIQAGGSNISISGAGSNISVQGAGANISLGAEGTEARPRNVAWCLAVKH